MAELIDFHEEKLTKEEIAAITAINTNGRMKIMQTVDELPCDIPYRLHAYPRRVAMHIGQRKLLLTEVEFLTKYAKDGDTIVYAGAGPGIHIPTLVGLFSHIKLTYELWDPSGFNLIRNVSTNLSNVRTHKEYFTSETAERFASREDILFISDIRVNEVEGELPTEDRVEKDMVMQEEWVRIMQPRAYMLKFRLRYMTGDCPNIPFEYLPGETYIQPFAPQSSSETRLVASRAPGEIYGSRIWDQKLYDNRMYYLNSIMREWGCFKHDAAINYTPGLDTCFDCAREAQIWEKYSDVLGRRPDINSLFNLASRGSRRLDRLPHGYAPQVPLIDKRHHISQYGELRGQYIAAPDTQSTINAPAALANAD